MTERRKLLWDSMLDAEMNVHYWTLQQDRHSRYSTLMRVVIALASSGTVATLWLLDGHPNIQKSITAISGTLSIIYAILFPPEKQSKIAALLATWREICAKYRMLWARDKDLSDTKCWEEFEGTASRSIDESVVGKSSALLKKAYCQVCISRNLKTEETNG
jgi:hypothetical protein